MPDIMVNVRYMVDDVDAAVAWYTNHLGFEILSNASPAFADVRRGALRLLLSGPKSSAGRPMADGEQPKPGGWNRVHFIVDDLKAEVAACVLVACNFETRSSVGLAVRKSSCRTRQEILLNCSNRPSLTPHDESEL